MSRLFIFGAGQVAETCAYYFRTYASFEEIMFVVDDDYLGQTAQQCDGHQVLPYSHALSLSGQSDKWFVAIAYRKRNTLREAVYERLERIGLSFTSLVHPSCHIWDGFVLRPNVIVMENNIFQYKSSLGHNSIVWSSNHIGHHSQLGNNLFVASEVVVSGNCTIGDNCFLGVNATVVDGVEVGAFSAIGAGTVVKNHVDVNCVVR